MNPHHVSYRACLLAALFIAAPTLFAQDDPPTLKLDRIMPLPAFAGQTRAPAAARSSYRVETVAAGLSLPWALAFLPEGGMLISERRGALRILHSNGKLSEPLSGLPAISDARSGGLFDVALSPDYSVDGQLYFSFVAPGRDDDRPIPRVARATLNVDGRRLENVEIIVDGQGTQEIHFAPDGTLFVAGAGDVWNDDAQDLAITFGKLLRFNPDGSIPSDNPWVDDPAVPDEIYSYGHRDVAGLATHPETGELWMAEHGPRGGDELNLMHAGANYGWKLVSYGTDYNGDVVGDGRTEREGVEQPRYFWAPSIAPSGLIFYSGTMFPEWQKSAFVSGLSGQHISRIEMDGDKVVAEERLLVDRAQRIRELRVGPDGALYALTNEESDAPKGTAELLRIFR